MTEGNRRKVLITRNFHPNERVANIMALEVAVELRRNGYDVELVDLEDGRESSDWAQEMSRDILSRDCRLERVIERHGAGRAVFDFHDSDIRVVEEVNRTYGRSFQLPDIEKGGDFNVVEVPAIYGRQLDIAISDLAVRHGVRMAGYFLETSDVKASDVAGLMGGEMAKRISKKIDECF